MLLDRLPDGLNLPNFLHMFNQRQAFGPVDPFSEQEKDFLACAGGQVNVQLEDSAGVHSGEDFVFQSYAAESRRSTQVSQASQKFRAVCCQTVGLFVSCQKSHTLAKLTVVMIAGK